MKIAVLGDVHGNHLALDAVLSSAAREKVDNLLVTGDLVGYYPFVKEVFELLDPWDRQVVKGNHEVMLQNALSDLTYLERITKKYGSSIKIAIETLSETQIDELVNLPKLIELELNDMPISLCHGSPLDVNEYIYPDSDLSKLSWLPDITSQLIICGHTHYPMLREWNEKKILNPGSVGQSRNGIAKAHWVLFDTEERTFKFMIEDYNINIILDAVRAIDPTNLYLQKVLTR
jgi:putative phosphoesterase